MSDKSITQVAKILRAKLASVVRRPLSWTIIDKLETLKEKQENDKSIRPRKSSDE